MVKVDGGGYRCSNNSTMKYPSFLRGHLAYEKQQEHQVIFYPNSVKIQLPFPRVSEIDLSSPASWRKETSDLFVFLLPSENTSSLPSRCQKQGEVRQHKHIDGHLDPMEGHF